MVICIDAKVYLEECIKETSEGLHTVVRGKRPVGGRCDARYVSEPVVPSAQSLRPSCPTDTECGPDA